MLTIPLTAIVIPPNRQRGAPEAEAVAALADSIEKHGLLHPPVVGDDPECPDKWVLRAGHTRLLAIQLLASQGQGFRCGDVTILAGQCPVLPMTDLSPLQAFEVELEENVRRAPLPWQKQADAYATLHRMRAEAGSSPREAIRETQAIIAKIAPGEVRGLSEAHQTILLGQHLSDPDIAKAKTRSDAIKILGRKLQREADTATVLSADQSRPSNLFHGDCLVLMAQWPAASFDAVVSDPPYGIGITQLSYQNASEQEYDDSYENWVPLMRGCFEAWSRLLKPNASGFLFCDFSRFDELWELATASGFECFPRPLIWDRSPDGRLTTPEKWPRRCYECVLYFRRGTRQLFEIRGDVLHYPADRSSDNYHGAKKPVPLLVDMLERICRPGDRILDPFAGSGATVRAARSLHIDCWAIEQDEAYFGLLQRLLAADDNQPELPL